LEWTTRQLQRGPTVLAPSSKAIQMIRGEIATFQIIWAALNRGCLVKINHLPRHILKNLTDSHLLGRLHPDAYLFLWFQPNPWSIGWAQARRPNGFSIILDVEHNRVTTVDQLSQRTLEARYVASRPAQYPSYVWTLRTVVQLTSNICRNRRYRFWFVNVHSSLFET
jgi:hypothetical protein